tara:strand:- start:4 stop:273 length:270 start_codon:yes stop_codon:yes gene_type:complete
MSSLEDNINNLSKIQKAIKSINPNAHYELTDIDNIIWKNNTTPISKLDIESKLFLHQEELDKKITDKASADAKLKALGLTDDEIKAIKS